jgi:transcriptional regulator with XRE-family HTH domain
MSTWKAYRAELARILAQFGENVRGLREQKERETERRYGQEKLAGDARLHRTEIGKIERAEVEPRLTTLLILADGLGVTLNDLVGDLPVPKERKPPPETPKD